MTKQDWDDGEVTTTPIKRVLLLIMMMMMMMLTILTAMMYEASILEMPATMMNTWAMVLS